jgi:hypothetical protein
MDPDTRPSPSSGSSGSSGRASKKASLTLDLSDLPPLVPPTRPSNTLIFTNLQDPAVFRPDNLQTIRDLISHTAPIHAWAPLKSFRRIVVSFFDDASAIRVRGIWDGEAVLGERCRVYFGQPTPISPEDGHLALPDAGKLFFISPPPSPPHGWEMRLEDAPNKTVHAEDLAEALARLRHNGAQSPVSPVDKAEGFGDADGGARTRSRSSTLIYHPEEHGGSPNLPSIAVDDMTDDSSEDSSPTDRQRPVMGQTVRPPVELMQDT